jgi:hypothetical protein
MQTIVGLDLGQSADPSALAVVQAHGQDAKGRTVWHVPHLQRWPLGTPYTQIVPDVAALVKQLDRPTLIIDRTGCGAPVFDFFAAANLAVSELVGAMIHGGATMNRATPDVYSIPKRDLAGVVRTVWESGRVKIAKGLKESATLVRELQTFTVKINIATGNESFEAWRSRDHDDLVFSVALALWYAEAIPEPNWNIRQLNLAPPLAPPERRDKIIFPAIRYFHQSDGYQPLPELRGERVPGCPTFREQSQAAYFVLAFCRAMGEPEPDCTADIDAEAAAEIEKRVNEFITQRRLVPAH